MIILRFIKAKSDTNMIGPMNKNHRHEWPVAMMWYTKHAGKTIERIIDTDIDYFEWMVRTFQLVTPMQAAYYKLRTGRIIPPEYIQDVVPYQWRKGDPDGLYMEICDTQDLTGTIRKYRGEQLSMF